jgi:hypothetical protein
LSSNLGKTGISGFIFITGVGTFNPEDLTLGLNLGTFIILPLF